MRKPLDFYPTPARLTHELLKRVDISGTVFECCAGDGAIARELETPHLNSLKIEEVFTNDINLKYKTTFNQDATKPINWYFEFITFDWVITNPPFNNAHKILPLAWGNCKVGMAMLLRLTYLEPAGNRGEWLAENSKYLTDLIIFGQPRPSFTADGKVDSCTTAWFVWQKESKRGTQLHFVTDWKN